MRSDITHTHSASTILKQQTARDFEVHKAIHSSFLKWGGVGHADIVLSTHHFLHIYYISFLIDAIKWSFYVFFPSQIKTSKLPVNPSFIFSAGSHDATADRKTGMSWEWVGNEWWSGDEAKTKAKTKTKSKPKPKLMAGKPKPMSSQMGGYIYIYIIYIIKGKSNGWVHIYIYILIRMSYIHIYIY
jgi:hypothetical protein